MALSVGASICLHGRGRFTGNCLKETGMNIRKRGPGSRDGEFYRDRPATSVAPPWWLTGLTACGVLPPAALCRHEARRGNCASMTPSRNQNGWQYHMELGAIPAIPLTRRQVDPSQSKNGRTDRRQRVYKYV